MYKHSLKEIVSLLLESETPLRIRDIAEKLHMSEKTVWNKLHDEEIKTLLKDRVKLEMKPNNGIYLCADDAEALEELKADLTQYMDHEKVNNMYISNQIIMMLFMHEGNVTMQELMDHFLITKKSLSIYLQDVESRLYKFSLQMEKRQNAGIRITGDEINIRQFIEHTILQQCGFIKQSHHQNITFDESITAILKEIHLDEYLENALACVKQVQQELLGTFTDEGRKEIVIQILITNNRCAHEYPIHVIEQDSFTSNIQFQKFLKIFEINRFFLKENDYLYLWKRCITNRFSVSAEKKLMKNLNYFQKSSYIQY